MNLSELQRKLIAAARTNAPEDRVPYAFEKRIMARLAGQTAPDLATLWGRALMRAAVYSVIFMVLLAGGSYLSQTSTTASNTPTLSQDVDQALFAAVDNNNSSDTESWQ